MVNVLQCTLVFPYSGLRVTAQSSIFMTCKCQPWPCMYRGERILKTITNTQYVWVVCGKQRSLAVGLLTLASCSRLVAEIIMHHSYSIVTRRKSLPSSRYLVVVETRGSREGAMYPSSPYFGFCLGILVRKPRTMTTYSDYYVLFSKK